MVEILHRNDLVRAFAETEKSPDQFRIGAESEKFGVHRESGAPLLYSGEFSVSRVIQSLCTEHGWSESVEVEGGPVLGAKRGGASVTLEPGAQFELSGEAFPDLHLIGAETEQHLRELGPISREMGIAWLATGFHPSAKLADLPWVPKQRYPIMREYLPQKGKAGLDMMQRTCTTQGNFDWSSESDAMIKLTVALKLSPLIQAWFSNAPFKEGRAGELLSHRAKVWQHMDPARSGLIRSLWTRPPHYEDYVEWALDAGMFLVRRGDQIIRNTGQTFRDFMSRGFEGHHATLDDWRTHLVTLFPEVRLKNTLEVRSVDVLPPELALAALGVWTGILYDQRSLNDTATLLASWSYEELEGSRSELCSRALHAPLFGRSGFEWAADVLQLAEQGLKRRARLDETRRDESVYLHPAREILESRLVPAERALQIFKDTGSLVAATEIELPSPG
jgi:glutamate--cysteine ligase